MNNNSENSEPYLYLEDTYLLNYDKEIKKAITLAWDDDDGDDELADLSLFISQQKRYYSQKTPGMSDLSKTLKTLKTALKSDLSLSKNQGDNFSDIEIEDSANLCDADLTNYVSANLNFGLYVLTHEQEDKELLLLEVIKRLAPYVKKYDKNSNFNKFFENCWTICETENIGIDFQDELSKANFTPMEMKLTDILSTCINSSQKLDKVSLICNGQYDSFVLLSSKSAITFQQVCNLLRDKMKEKNFPEYFQEFLEIFLNDLQLKAFDNLGALEKYYKKELRDVIELLKDDGANDDGTAIELLGKIRQSCYDDFLILITHFPKYLYLREL